MESTQHTFAVYFQQIVDNMLPEGAPERDKMAALFAAFSSRPLVELGPEAAQLFDVLAGLPNSYKLIFQLGTQVPLTAYAPIAMPMKFAPTIGQSLKFLSRFMHLQAPVLSAHYEQEDGGVRVTFTMREPMTPEGELFLATGAFCALSTEIATISGNRSNLRDIHITDAPPAALALFEKLLGVRPETGHDTNSCFIERTVLDTPNPFADPLSFARYEAMYEAQEQEFQHRASIAESLKQRIFSSIENPPSFDELAAELRMSERQLRFALAKEGTNYRELLKNCRIDFARTQLANPRMSITKLAHRLGYADVTAFNHGFKRWTGLSPTQFQASLQKQNPK